MFKTRVLLKMPEIGSNIAFEVTAATSDDAKTLREIADEVKIDAWTESDYRDEIGRTDSVVFKAQTENRRIIGFVMARLVPGLDFGSDAEIYNIAVRQDFQRFGTGSILFSALLRKLRSEQVQNVWLEVRESNVKAIEFYRKQGFLDVSTRLNFYSNPVETAIVMRLSLVEKFP
jgi:ribosomal-protein-alanine N-acetyltransferase